MNSFDLAIVGGGPAGYVAAERAVEQGLSVVLFERREVGGVCLNEGCIPTKTLLYGAKTFDSARHADKYGVSCPDPSFDYGRMVARKNKVVRKLVAGVKMKLHDVEVVKGEAVISGHSPEGFRIECTSAAPETPDTTTLSFTSRKLLLCTGAEAFIPPIPGAQEARSSDTLLTSREILELKERPGSLIIIGGGVIGMEFASLFNSLGTPVTVVEQMVEILGTNNREISEMLRATYTKRGVAFHLSSRVTRIDGNDVFFTDSEGSEHKVSGDKILVSVGRKPNTTGYGLENLNVELDRGGIRVDTHMRTSAADVWAAGDVTGFSMLAHTASREAEVAVNDIVDSLEKASKKPEKSHSTQPTKADTTMSYAAIPGVVYTNPEIASVGLTLEAAQAKNVNVKELRLPMSYSGRFVAENEGGEGLCKIVIADAPATDPFSPGQVLGVHLIGNPASEIIWGACLAIEQGLDLDALKRTIFPHPSVSEIVKEAVFTD